MSKSRGEYYSYECGPDARLQAVELDGALERWSDAEGTFLVCLDAWSPEETGALMRRLGLGDEAIDAILETGHAPRVRAFEQSVLFEYPTRMDRELSQLVTTSAICLDRLLLLLRREPGAVWDAERVSRFRPIRPSAGGMLATVLADHSLELRRDALEVRHRVVALARRMDSESESMDGADIVQLRGEIIDLDAIVEERIPVLESLFSDRVHIQEDEAVQDEIQLALTNTHATARRLDRIDRRLSEVQSRFDAHLQEKMNRRLSRLTIISAIFLPLTLIAGIYGMNFERMPELRYPFAYPLTIGGMLVLAVGMLVWFKRRGWMD